MCASTVADACRYWSSPPDAARSHIPGIAQRRPRVLTGHLSCRNNGLTCVAVALDRSTLALGMALCFDALRRCLNN
jgi:hypothetical protein